MRSRLFPLRYSPKCVEGVFSEVHSSKRPTELSRKRPRAAWWHRFGVETHLPSSVRCAAVYQGVAARNAPTTREILAHMTGAEPNFAFTAFSEVGTQHSRCPTPMSVPG